MKDGAVMSKSAIAALAEATGVKSFARLIVQLLGFDFPCIAFAF